MDTHKILYNTHFPIKNNNQMTLFSKINNFIYYHHNNITANIYILNLQYIDKNQ